VFRVASRVARVIPRSVGHRIARAAGPLLRRRMAAAAAQVDRNLDHILGPSPAPDQRRRQIEATLASYATYWFDALRGMRASPAEVVGLIDITGQEHLDAGVAAGNGVICVMPHLGNWDHGGAWLATRYPLTVVAEELQPPELFGWFVDLRRRNGMEVVALGSPSAATVLAARLRSGGVVGLLCDRDIDRSGTPVVLLGETTTMSAGPATLALRTGAAVVPTASVYAAGGRIHGIIGPPIRIERTGRLRDDVARLTQAIADELSDLIRRHPTQWHVLQPTWPSDPGHPGARREPTTGA
jgi:KDO2-lipid IV(A) lauroyltransferase